MMTGRHVTTLIAALLMGEVTGLLAIIAIAHYVIPAPQG